MVLEYICLPTRVQLLRDIVANQLHLRLERFLGPARPVVKLLLAIRWRSISSTIGISSAGVCFPHLLDVKEKVFHLPWCLGLHSMAVKGLQFLHIIFLKILIIGLCDQLEVTCEVEANDIKIEVLLEDVVCLQELCVLLIHQRLDLHNVFEQLLSLLGPFLCEMLDLFLQLLGLLQHGFLFELPLILQESHLFLHIFGLLGKQLLAILLFLFKLPIFVEVILL